MFAESVLYLTYPEITEIITGKIAVGQRKQNSLIKFKFNTGSPLKCYCLRTFYAHTRREVVVDIQLGGGGGECEVLQQDKYI